MLCKVEAHCSKATVDDDHQDDAVDSDSLQKKSLVIQSGFIFLEMYSPVIGTFWTLAFRSEIVLNCPMTLSSCRT